MRHTEQEILQALKTIKDVCMYEEDHGYKDCKDCPLRLNDSGFCGVNTLTPDSWDFYNHNERKWRAFKVND